VARKGRPRLRALSQLVAQAYPQLDAVDTIRRGVVVVDGRVATNPASLVREGASLTIRGPVALRGEAKLRAALELFDVCVCGRVALDLGAAAGGFTRVLVDAGAKRVYAVDVGHGQLLGSLRRHPRVVNLERTNLAELSRELVPDLVDVVTADLSYVPLASAIPQLNRRVRLAHDADLVALVKPQFELALPVTPTDSATLGAALREAQAGIEAAGWHVVATAPSPVRGSRGAVELLLHARRRS
jgi:23S rRNA (cytidine1920-2'-O)/16S rRNA (cytidine1409-2'-O)-methyltransferase